MFVESVEQRGLAECGPGRKHAAVLGQQMTFVEHSERRLIRANSLKRTCYSRLYDNFLVNYSSRVAGVWPTDSGDDFFVWFRVVVGAG